MSVCYIQSNNSLYPRIGGRRANNSTSSSPKVGVRGRLSWAQQESNLQPTSYEPGALPLSYGPSLQDAATDTYNIPFSVRLVKQHFDWNGPDRIGMVKRHTCLLRLTSFVCRRYTNLITILVFRFDLRTNDFHFWFSLCQESNNFQDVVPNGGNDAGNGN